MVISPRSSVEMCEPRTLCEVFKSRAMMMILVQCVVFDRSLALILRYYLNRRVCTDGEGRSEGSTLDDDVDRAGGNGC